VNEEVLSQWGLLRQSKKSSAMSVCSVKLPSVRNLIGAGDQLQASIGFTLGTRISRDILSFSYTHLSLQTSSKQSYSQTVPQVCLSKCYTHYRKQILWFMYSFTAYWQARKNGLFKCYEKSLNDKNLKCLRRRGR